jgi:hypothetical protein
MGERHARQYKIRFMPKSKSFQLVGGYLIVSDNVWSVREMRFSGRNEMVRFNNLVKMGNVGDSDEFLPLQYDVDATFRFLGNVVDGTYEAVLDYKNIIQKTSGSDIRRSVKKSKYDLSDSYTLRTDTNAYLRDTAYFKTLRPIPLTPHEETLYQDFFLRRDTLARKKKPVNKNLEFWGQIGDALISRYTVDLDKLGSVRCSPLINPFLLSYSGKHGISYRQEFKYNRIFTGDRLLRIVPRIGYNFKEKEFYWRVRSDFDYWPRKRAALHLEFGNGNRIYSSKVVEKIKDIPDSLFNFDDLHLDYFNDLFFELNHSVEVTNGFFIKAGVTVHQRDAVKPSTIIILQPGGESDGSLDLISELKTRYISFAPRLQLEWTPGQFYYLKTALFHRLHSKKTPDEMPIHGQLTLKSVQIPLYFSPFETAFIGTFSSKELHCVRQIPGNCSWHILLPAVTVHRCNSPDPALLLFPLYPLSGE